MRAVSRYGALTYMNKGNWFLTWRGPSKVNAFDAGNKIVRKRKVNRSFFFTMNNKLAKDWVDVKLHLRGYLGDL
jgi:hypothetical protein